MICVHEFKYTASLIHGIFFRVKEKNSIKVEATKDFLLYNRFEKEIDYNLCVWRWHDCSKAAVISSVEGGTPVGCLLGDISSKLNKLSNSISIISLQSHS